MGLLDGIGRGINRGISAAGYAGGEMYARGALEDQRATIQAERDKRLAEMAEEAAIRGEQRGIANRATERAAIVEETVANTPRLTQAQIDAQNAKGNAELRFFEENKDRLLGKKSAEAAATRNPLEDRVANVRLQNAQLDLEAKKLEAKMPPAVKTRADSLRDEIKTINAAIAKAQAEGMFDANSDNAKSLLDRYTAKASQLDKLLSPFYGDKGPKAEDTPAAKQDVRVGGQVIGQAATPEEAKAMVDAHLKARKPGGQPASKADAAPVDRIGDGVIGPMTPMAMIEESARAGNKRAIQYLERRQEGLINNDLLPRTAADMLNQQ